MIKTDNSTNGNATGTSSTGSYVKEASRSPLSQSVYLYSSMNKASKNSNVQETKEGKVILNNFRGYKVKTMRNGTIDDTTEQEIYSCKLCQKERTLAGLKGPLPVYLCTNRELIGWG